MTESGSPKPIASIKSLLEPTSVAVIGASRNPTKFGSIIIFNLIQIGYEGKIYPVNPQADEIFGLKAYPSLKAIPDKVDLAVIATPSSRSLEAMIDCAEKQVKGVVIIASGFKEAGEEGKKLEEEIVRIAKETGIRIFGPNTTGLLNTSKKFTTTFAPLKSLKKGHLSFIAQTGMFAGAMLFYIITVHQLAISKVIGLGNKCDVDDAEALEYLGEDPETKVIIMYIEGIKNGQRFLNAARTVSQKKPIIALKSGRTEEGMKAALSHTGSIAGNISIFEAACKQAGVIRAENVEDMFNLAKGFLSLPLPKGKQVAIMSMSGGGAAMAADACISYGLKLAQLRPETLARLQSRAPNWARISHPVDIEPLSENTDSFKEMLEFIINEVMGNESVNSGFMWLPSFLPEWKGGPYWIEDDEMIEVLRDIRRKFPEKPFILCSAGDKEGLEQFTNVAEKAETPLYPSFPTAFRVLKAMVDYANYRQAITKGLHFVNSSLV